MMLNKDKHEDSSEDDVDTVNKIPIADMVKICDQLIADMEQHAFISEHEIIIFTQLKRDCLDKKLIREMTWKKTFKKATSFSATEPENSAPGPSPDA